MLTSPPTCPVCVLGDKTYKVSLLYLEASARLHRREMTNQPELEAALEDVLPENCTADEQTKALARMAQVFSPPEGGRQVTRRIHPDWMIIFLFAVGLIFVYQTAGNQPGSQPVLLSLLGLSMLFYLLLRKPILRRYSAILAEEQAAKVQIERAVARWMRLYYCSRDQIVFDPEENRFVPLEQIAALVEQ